MKKLMTGIALLAIAGSASAALVDYSAAAQGLTEGPIYDVNNTSEMIQYFDTSTEMFVGGGFYGGARAASYDGSGVSSTNNATGGVIVQDGWPHAEDTVFVYANDSSGGVGYQNVNMVYLWDTAPAAFETASSLSVNITDWQDSSWYTGAYAGEIRHIIRQTGQAANTYWVSEAVATGAGAFTLTDFNNNSTVGQRWTEITLTSTDFAIGDLSGATWSAEDFTDVESVGWIGEGSKHYSGVLGFDEYTATVPEPATIGMLGLGALVVALVRRMRA